MGEVAVGLVDEQDRARALGQLDEGVERADQQEFVRRAGITAVQGRLHHPPVPAADFAAWLARERPAATVVA